MTFIQVESPGVYCCFFSANSVKDARPKSNSLSVTGFQHLLSSHGQGNVGTDRSHGTLAAALGLRGNLPHIGMSLWPRFAIGFSFHQQILITKILGEQKLGKGARRYED